MGALELEEQRWEQTAAQPTPRRPEAVLLPRQVDQLISDYRIAVAELRQAGHEAERAREFVGALGKELALQIVEATARREAQAINRLLSYQPQSFDEALVRADFLVFDNCAVHWWEAGPREEDVALLARSMASLKEVGWRADY